MEPWQPTVLIQPGQVALDAGGSLLSEDHAFLLLSTLLRWKQKRRMYLETTARKNSVAGLSAQEYTSLLSRVPRPRRYDSKKGAKSLPQFLFSHLMSAGLPTTNDTAPIPPLPPSTWAVAGFAWGGGGGARAAERALAPRAEHVTRPCPPLPLPAQSLMRRRNSTSPESDKPAPLQDTSLSWLGRHEPVELFISIFASRPEEVIR